VSTQVTQTQYSLAVRDDDRAYVVLGPVFQDIVDVAFIVNAYEEAAWPTVNQTEFLTCQTHGRRVHQRHHFTYIFCQQTVEEFLVSILRNKTLCENQRV
jgi:hypothetical protein